MALDLGFAFHHPENSFPPPFLDFPRSISSFFYFLFFGLLPHSVKPVEKGTREEKVLRPCMSENAFPAHTVDR